MSERAPWDVFWLLHAQAMSMRSTCPRASVGCILVIDNRHVVSGYNGAISGDEHCSDVGCQLVNGHCQRSVHAEANAIADAARRGVSVAGATAYVTHAPCINCAKLLLSAGIVRIVYVRPYNDGSNMDYLGAHAVRVQVQQMEVGQ